MGVSLFSRAAAAQIQLEPFPHLVIENALEPELYAELERHWPAAETITRGSRVENNRIYLRPAVDVAGSEDIAPIWQEFFNWHTSQAFLTDALRIWGDTINANYPDLEQDFGKALEAFTVGVRQPGKRRNPVNRSADAMIDCVFGIHSAVTEVSKARGPHVDNPAKMFSALLYFRDPQDDCTGGDFELFRCPEMPYPRGDYKAIPEQHVEHVSTVKYAPNTLVSWINSAGSIHGVSPRSLTDRERRYIAVTAECYAGPQDYFLQHDGWAAPIRRDPLSRVAGWLRRTLRS